MYIYAKKRVEKSVDGYKYGLVHMLLVDREDISSDTWSAIQNPSSTSKKHSLREVRLWLAHGRVQSVHTEECILLMHTHIYVCYYSGNLYIHVCLFFFLMLFIFLLYAIPCVSTLATRHHKSLVLVLG